MTPWQPTGVQVETPPQFSYENGSEELNREKQKFARHLMRFVARGCRDTDFHLWFYKRLSLSMGHIAHYNRGGFYAEWFASRQSQVRFLQYHGGHGVTASWSDVQQWFHHWIARYDVVKKYEDSSPAWELRAGRTFYRADVPIFSLGICLGIGPAALDTLAHRMEAVLNREFR